LGHRVVFKDVNNDGFDDLIASSPLFDPEWWVPPNDETGLVSIWYGGDKFPTGVINDAYDIASWQVQGPLPLTRFGHHFTVWDNDNDGALELVVGAPRCSIGNPVVEMGGCVFLYSLSS